MFFVLCFVLLYACVCIFLLSLFSSVKDQISRVLLCFIASWKAYLLVFIMTCICILLKHFMSSCVLQNWDQILCVCVCVFWISRTTDLFSGAHMIIPWMQKAYKFEQICFCCSRLKFTHSDMDQSWCLWDKHSSSPPLFPCVCVLRVSVCACAYRGFPTRMVYLYYISCLRYTILVGNPGYASVCVYVFVCLVMYLLWVYKFSHLHHGNEQFCLVLALY